MRKLVEGDEKSNKKTQNKKYIVARRRDMENWPDEERKRGMQFNESGELLG